MEGRLGLLTLAVSLLSHLLLVQDGRWVEAVGLAPMATMLQQQARTTALNQARADAVRQVAGVKIQSESFRVQTERISNKDSSILVFFASVNRDVACGRVVQEEILSEGPATFPTIAGQTPQVYYQVKIRAQVAMEQGAPDPAFRVHVKINNEIYRENDTMTIDLQATQNGFVYVFNILVNDSLLGLFPNRYFQDNFLPGNTSLHLMPEGFIFQVSLVPGMLHAQEFIYVVATKECYNFAPTWRDETQPLRTASTPGFTFLELPRWLANIPPDKRTDRFVGYEVCRPKEN